MLDIGLDSRTIVISVMTSAATASANTLPNHARSEKLFQRPTAGSPAGLLDTEYFPTPPAYLRLRFAGPKK